MAEEHVVLKDLVQILSLRVIRLSFKSPELDDALSVGRSDISDLISSYSK